MNEVKWYLRTQDETFGPETEAKLVEWARLGRIQPGQEISDDNVIWKRVEEVPFLDMRFSIDIGDGNPRGPFNQAAAAALLASGRLPPVAKMIEVREPFGEEKVEKADEVEKDEREVKVVEKVVEKRVEVPVEKIVEKVVEVPVEKIVEKEVVKTVVDETRVRELEGILEEERRHSGDLQAKLDAASKAAAELRQRIVGLEGKLAEAEAAAKDAAVKLETSAKDAVDRELKLNEQVKALEDELRRLPQAASEVANVQAAVYSIMTKDAEELAVLLEAEKQDAEDFRRRHEARAERLLERRRELVKRAGANIEDMTRKALVERPEDPRTAQLRQELGETKRAADKAAADAADRIRVLEAKLADGERELKRTISSAKDLTELRNENEAMRQKLQLREKELVAEREKSEAMRQRQAMSQQALLSRLQALESPSIGTSRSLSTNQSREAKLVKLPGWMRLGK